MTNAEKFKEVFGYEPRKTMHIFDCDSCPHVDDCAYYADNDENHECTVSYWWDEEYKNDR